ncbi:MAG: class I tRNA ligase family protein, partial [Brevundimonas sp.]|nr:class I tRNA ligase family protein [Brevundimonas sp.]
TQIDVAFEITESPIAELVGAHAVIWTTTPWTIPANQALAYGPEVEYGIYTVAMGATGQGDANIAAAQDNHPLRHLSGKKLLIAVELEGEFRRRVDATLPTMSDGAKPRLALLGPSKLKGSDLAGTVARHPMHALGGFFAKPRPFLAGDFVTTDSGTGLVHMAPDHGEDDFLLCKSAGIEPVFAVEGDGRYRDDWAWLGGQDERRRSVINPKFNSPDGPICADLKLADALLSAGPFKHSYPHSWRSKEKVIFRCTPQWFVPMDQARDDGTLREKAMAAIEATRFVPEKGRNRIGSMVEGRPDWVLSRQRAWGVPITLFVHRQSGQYLVDEAVNARIIAAVKAEGVDAWSAARAQEYLGSEYKSEDFEQVTDILDVWFDSGCTHAFVLESGRWPELQWPADL